MPSKQINEMMGVEELVHDIKEKFQLKANPTSSTVIQRTAKVHRSSPYRIPNRSWNEPNVFNMLPIEKSLSAVQEQLQPDQLPTVEKHRELQLQMQSEQQPPSYESSSSSSQPPPSSSSSSLMMHEHHQHTHNSFKQKNDQPLHQQIEDPYELLQALIRDNNLVKEAVRRLKLNIPPKQRFFYESDDESRSPIIRVCQPLDV